MALQVEQLVYTSFPETGFKGLAGPQLPAHVLQGFVDAIVHRYWNAYSPPSVGYRAVYLHQLSDQDYLFGWLYSDGSDEMGREGVPYFVCYYLAQTLEEADLNLILDCLECGPLTQIDRQQMPSTLAPVIVPDDCHYLPTQLGVAIPPETREKCLSQLYQQDLLDFGVQFEPQTGAIELQTDFEPLTIEEAELLSPLSAGNSVLPQDNAVSTVAGNKVALLIGVSEYGAGFPSLPGVLKDVEALRRTLENPEQGGFDEVQPLLNPDPQAMAEAIEALFLDRSPEDLVLLYFSGYVSLLDTQGKLGLTTALSRHGTNGNVVRSTVIPADFINDVMGDSRSQHQTLILDWCMDELPVGVEQRTVKFAPQFIGDRRTVLMSSASTQTVAAPPMGSAYTFFLVEGLRTGAADLNYDGSISLDEWHAYARRKLKQASPALDPKLYGDRAAKTQVGFSPLREPRFEYRRQVEDCSPHGKVSVANRVVLNTLYPSLGLSLEEAAIIEAEVLKPSRDYHEKLQRYAIAFTQAIQQTYPLTPHLHRQFKQFQRQLGLTDANIVSIESELVHRINVLRDPDGTARPFTPTEDHRSAAPRPLNQVLEQGYGVVQPLSNRVAIATRHFLTRCQQALTKGAAVGSPTQQKLRRLYPIGMASVFMGVSVGAALLVMIFNQPQVANRRPERISPRLPRTEGALSVLERTQEKSQ